MRADSAVSTRSWTGAVALVVLAGAAVWAAFVGFGPADLDAAALGGAVGVRHPVLTDVAITITTIGSTVAMAVLALLGGAVLWRAHRPVDAAYLVATMATTALVFRGIKILLDRPRPPRATQVIAETNESLPSGHAAMSVAVLGALVVLVWAGRSAATRALLVAVAGAWVVGVGATRVYLGVHWFSDIVAGWTVGAAWLTVCTLVWQSVRPRG